MTCDRMCALFAVCPSSRAAGGSKTGSLREGEGEGEAIDGVRLAVSKPGTIAPGEEEKRIAPPGQRADFAVFCFRCRGVQQDLDSNGASQQIRRVQDQNSGRPCRSDAFFRQVAGVARAFRPPFRVSFALSSRLPRPSERHRPLSRVVYFFFFCLDCEVQSLGGPIGPFFGTSRTKMPLFQAPSI